MERLESIFDSIKERLANPFIFSFIAAWLTFNWEVTLALFWFDSADLRAKGYSNLIDFINANTNNWSWGVPVLLALGYTFGMPLFKMGIEWFNAMVLKWTNDRLFKISEETPVSYGKYFELKKEQKKLIDELASDVNSASQKAQEYAEIKKRMNETESSYGLTINDLKDKIKVLINEKEKLINEKTVSENQQISLVSKINSVQNELDELKKVSTKSIEFISKYNDRRVLDGQWEFQYDNKAKNISFSEKIEIIDGVFYSMSGTQSRSTLRINSFFNDVLKDEMLVILEFIPDTDEGNFIRKTNPIVGLAKTNDFRLAAAYNRVSSMPIIVQKIKWKNNLLAGVENIEAIISYKKLGQRRVIGSNN